MRRRPRPRRAKWAEQQRLPPPLPTSLPLPLPRRVRTSPPDSLPPSRPSPPPPMPCSRLQKRCLPPARAGRCSSRAPPPRALRQPPPPPLHCLQLLARCRLRLLRTGQHTASSSRGSTRGRLRAPPPARRRLAPCTRLTHSRSVLARSRWRRQPARPPRSPQKRGGSSACGARAAGTSMSARECEPSTPGPGCSPDSTAQPFDLKSARLVRGGFRARVVLRRGGRRRPQLQRWPQRAASARRAKRQLRRPACCDGRAPRRGAEQGARRQPARE